MNQTKESHNNLYLLAFIDISDRLDILLLEIRHLQQSIIHYLRAPTLYLPLRYEEAYLFGENWDSYFRKGSTIAHDIELIRQWVIRYPTPDEAIQTYSTRENSCQDSELYCRVKYAVKKRVGQIWMGDNWARDQRAQYHALYALQLLKQRILRDKVAIYRGALEAGLTSTSGETKSLQKPAFMILRQAVIKNAHSYVSILSNHKQQLSQSIDFGMPSDPHPSTERRREMGIFMDFLSNRAQDIQRDILHLLSTFKHSPIDDETSNILMFHGWSQDARVTNFHLFDKTNYLYKKYHYFGDSDDPGDSNQTKAVNRPRKKHIGYVNTSFWTPDRPDLHPIIAHEIADSINKNALGRLDDVALSDSRDQYTLLLIKLKEVMLKHARLNRHMAFIKPRSRKFLQQIASDLLAAAVKGTSYLYALFLLRAADTLDDQLKAGAFIKLDMVYSLQEGTASFDNSLLWFLRLKLTAAWIEKISHVDISGLDKIVIDGVKSIADDTLHFLDEHAPQTRAKRAEFWHELAEELIDQFSEFDKTANICKQWREKRSEDDWIESCGKPGNRRYARSTRRLNVRLQNYLFRELLAQKRRKGKPLNGIHPKNLEVAFNELYPLEIELVDIPYVTKNRTLLHPTPLFRNMYDIPYQSAVLRSIDLLHQQLDAQDFLEQMRWDMELGRGLFAVALEFHARETESPEHRLALCINQIAYIFKELKETTNLDSADTKNTGKKNTHNTENELTNCGLKKALQDWLCLADPMPSYFDNPKWLTRKRILQLCKDIDRVSANEINKAFSYYKPIHSRQIRRLEELAGYKLQALLGILENHLPCIKNPTICSQLNALVQFLSIRRHLENSPKSEPKTIFYNYMLAAMGDISVPTKQAYEEDKAIKKDYLPGRVPSVMIHRLSLTNYYPVPDPAHLDQGNAMDSKDNVNGMTFAEVLKKDRWRVHYQNPEARKNRGFSNTWIALGRFDAISLIEVRLPCKCSIQGFEDGMQLPFFDTPEQDQKLHESGITQKDIKKKKRDALRNQIKEKFPPHFSRREIARPVEIISPPTAVHESEKIDEETENKPNQPNQLMDHLLDQLFAMIGVTLQRRSMRLDFLFRLIRALHFNEFSDYHSNLEKRIRKLKDKQIYVLAYLTDGWGDVLFTFRKQDSKHLSVKDIDAIFYFQQAVYEDFMVDRTEMVFTPRCIDVALNHPNKYRVSIQTRMMEDRWLEPGINRYINRLQALCNNPPKNLLSDVTVTLLTGRNDFSITFKGNDSDTSEGKYRQIIEWLSDSMGQATNTKNDAMQMLGHLETTIERILVSADKRL